METKAAVLYSMEHATPYGRSRPLVVETLELAGPGVGEVLVEMAGAGLCHSDLSVIDGSRPRVMPMVMGHEASGLVRDVGPQVHDLEAMNTARVEPGASVVVFGLGGVGLSAVMGARASGAHPIVATCWRAS